MSTNICGTFAALLPVMISGEISWKASLVGATNADNNHACGSVLPILNNPTFNVIKSTVFWSLSFVVILSRHWKCSSSRGLP